MNYVEEELTKMPLNIESCHHSVEFLDRYTQSYAQLVILDVDLLQGSLSQLVRILRSLNNEVKLFLILSPNQLKHCAEVISMGGVNYFIKPISIKNLVELVQSFLQPKMEG